MVLTALEPCVLCVGGAVMTIVGRVEYAGPDPYAGVAQTASEAEFVGAFSPTEEDTVITVVSTTGDLRVVVFGVQDWVIGRRLLAAARRPPIPAGRGGGATGRAVGLGDRLSAKHRAEDAGRGRWPADRPPVAGKRTRAAPAAGDVRRVRLPCGCHSFRSEPMQTVPTTTVLRA